MSVGVIMLVHTALDRAEQLARHWTASGCPVVLHVDRKVARPAYDAFVRALADEPRVRFCRRHDCEWGRWGIVQASQSASELMLANFPGVRHVFLASGSCLPLRPVRELIDFLDAHPRTDFIESVTTADVPWTVGGLDMERFTLRFPFSWKRHRRLFDSYVALQRRIGVRRRIPKRIKPHLGSQWWCLTRETLNAILSDPDRAVFERYFRRVWIPDESYYQSLVRLYSTNVESRSLTLCKFDPQGKPHVFYDDHLDLLRRSNCFVARKIWPQANGLYTAFLGDDAGAMSRCEPNLARIDRLILRAARRRNRGRQGLYMQSRLPHPGWENGVSAQPYSVLQGFCELFEDFESWLAKTTKARVHGHLFSPKGVMFSGGARVITGGLHDSAAARDYDPERFLTNLIWNTQGEHQCFQFGPSDNQAINDLIARDPNARISVISGAWFVSLFQSNLTADALRKRAATLQKIESRQLERLKQIRDAGRVRILTMADFLETPMEILQSLVDDIGPAAQGHLVPAPKMVDLDGFGQFLQDLRNQGMKPYLTGDFPLDDSMTYPSEPQYKPYLVG